MEGHHSTAVFLAWLAAPGPLPAAVSFVRPKELKSGISPFPLWSAKLATMIPRRKGGGCRAGGGWVSKKRPTCQSVGFRSPSLLFGRGSPKTALRHRFLLEERGRGYALGASVQNHTCILKRCNCSGILPCLSSTHQHVALVLVGRDEAPQSALRRKVQVGSFAGGLCSKVRETQLCRKGWVRILQLVRLATWLLLRGMGENNPEESRA